MCVAFSYVVGPFISDELIRALKAFVKSLRNSRRAFIIMLFRALIKGLHHNALQSLGKALAGLSLNGLNK